MLSTYKACVFSKATIAYHSATGTPRLTVSGIQLSGIRMCVGLRSIQKVREASPCSFFIYKGCHIPQPCSNISYFSRRNDKNYLDRGGVRKSLLSLRAPTIIAEKVCRQELEVAGRIAPAVKKAVGDAHLCSV